MAPDGTLPGVWVASGHLAAWLRAILLLWMGAYAPAIMCDGLRLAPAREQRAPPRLAVASDCGGLRLLPPQASPGPGLSLEKGLRVGAAGGVPKLPRIPGELSRQIEAAAAAFGHEASLVRAMVHVESAFNPLAVSPKGAIGLMQIMPATAAGLGVAAPRRALLDPATNLRAGARHLRRLRDKFPDRLDLVLAAYNAGEGAVARWAGVPPYAETRAYVQSVLEWRGRYQQGGEGGEPASPAAAYARSCGPAGED
ncbi:lytic transglycosylase domain-containing protein [Ramlibacter tataouinensis]|uniref:Peptidoglycan lytic transglycosylase, Glycoside Hydrolase Family 23-like protein n=1 Tax=Ramlibacter tataouinensis (strain ATCC BAA-407 / DSM 14655 / LMG 21543 / TTB310) TaxID=365046 RepID=F5XVX9_RAMTT|nr:lytic transglycosylase domain-containing protein [Ramlibacter tataouinensis]AEG94082.1 peptidoglycan lytic transglycosylase, Glycoside Hydrolase Family 23-like protein [Ramlibacter tataouinensis TTB310]